MVPASLNVASNYNMFFFIGAYIIINLSVVTLLRPLSTSLPDTAAAYVGVIPPVSKLPRVAVVFSSNHLTNSPGPTLSTPRERGGGRGGGGVKTQRN